MDKFFEKIARLHAGLKLGVGVGTMTVIFAGFWFGVAGGSGAKSDETQEKANLKRATEEFALAERNKAEEVRECVRLKKKLKRARRKMRKFRGMLPDDPAVSMLIKDIKSRLSGLALVEYNRRDELKSKIYATIPLDITVKGPFHSALKFFHEVSTMPRIVNVTDLVMENIELVNHRPQMDISFRVSTFRYLKKKKRRSRKGKKGKKTKSKRKGGPK
jgi:type IV pilus assembly protein PilO